LTTTGYASGQKGFSSEQKITPMIEFKRLTIAK